ncbi:MAG: type IV pilin N-terminal domain-containing protein [Methanoregulaceae archaeon]
MTRNVRIQERAVSPVVGIMLMLVVTLIIAAVVSAFAGGLTGGTTKAPQATVSASVTMPPSGNMTTFEHKGGDSFDLNDIKVTFQTQDTQTTLTTTDVGTNCIKFERVGSNATTIIKPGDRFVLVGTDDSYGSNYALAYGHLSLYTNSKITWTIADKSNGQAIASGEAIV